VPSKPFVVLNRSNRPAAAADRPADQFLVGEGAVGVRRVEKGDAGVEGRVDGGDRLGIVVRPVEVRHAHAAQP
jgi:hypothetical protein